jgi:peptidoglycan/LPS O-acetylase OafA/YrhL
LAGGLVSESSGRDGSYDVLRGVAVLLVVLTHFRVARAGSASWAEAAWAWVEGTGGVTFFLVLCGFFVGRGLFGELSRKGTLDYGRFVASRFWRLAPQHLALIGVTALAGLVTNTPLDPGRIASELLCVQNFRERGIWNHTWTLALQWQFFVTLPLVLLALVRWGRRDRIGRYAWQAAVAAMVLCLAARVWVTATTAYSERAWSAPTHLRIDTLVVGFALGYLSAERRWSDLLTPAVSRTMVLAGAAVYSTLGQFKGPDHTWFFSIGYSVVLASAALICVGGARLSLPDNHATRGLASMGRHSYGIYLWHLLVIEWFVARFATLLPGPALVVLKVAGSIAAGYLATRLIDGNVGSFRTWVTRRIASLRGGVTAPAGAAPGSALT